MKVNVTVGIDLPAYAEVEVEVDRAGDVAALIEAVRAVEDHELFFEVDWENYGGKRISVARDDQQCVVADGIPLQPVMYNGGAALMDWLTGEEAGGLSALVGAAERAMLIEPSETVAYTGALKGPAGEVVEVGFMARPAATREEMMVAFMDAVAANGWSFGATRAPATGGGAQ